MKINMEKDVDIIECDDEAGMIMIETLGVEPRCKYCDDKITKYNFGGVFSKPTRVCCNRYICLMQAIDDTENIDGTVDGIIKPPVKVGIKDLRFRWT